MSPWPLKAGIAGVVIVAATAYAVAQMPDHARMHGTMGNPDPQQMIAGRDARPNDAGSA